jgi:hypothetical protein
MVLRGRLAQLGERCSHIAEVTGSSPVSPTIFPTFLLSAQEKTRDSQAAAGFSLLNYQ